MSIATETNRWSYVGDGVTDTFPVTNKFLDDTDLEVYLELIADGTLTLQTLTTHYTVSGAGEDAGGDVAFVTPPSALYNVVIVRDVPATQPASFQPRKQLSPDGLDDAFDRAVILIQQLKSKLDRSIRLADGKSTPASFDGLTGDLANTYLAFDSNEQPFAAAGTIAGATVSAAMVPVVEAATLAAARTALGLAIGTDVAAATLALTAGAGLTGGGTLEANRTFAVGAGTGIVANADDVAVDKATQANMEAAAANKVVTADVLHFHPGVPKCWGEVTYSAGTPSINASYNVTSITDTGTGQLTVTIATDFADANYAALVTPVVADAAGPLSVRYPTKAAGSLLIETQNSGGSDADAVQIHWALLGDM